MKAKWQKWLVVALLLAVLGGVLTAPAAAQGVVWNTQFYNNAFLFEPAVVTRQDGAVAFDWGSGSPAQGVNADGFTARFASDPYFDAGTYRFYVLADDEVRLNVGYDFHAQIDTFDHSRVGQILTADITLTAGTHHVQVDYREQTGAAYVYVSWANLATNPAGPNFPVPSSLTSVNTGGWTAQYYGNATLTGSPTLIQTENLPSHDWGVGSPVASILADNFSARWTSVQTLEAARYTLNVRADDGVRVFIDGVAVINEWHGASGQIYSITLDLSGGQHNFMIEYYEANGNAYLDYSLNKVGVTVPVTGGNTNPPNPTGATGTVTVTRLNVRSSPATGGTVLVKINRGETYAIVGRNTDSTWWQINVNGTVGWVFGRFFTAANTASVPVTSGGATTPPPAATAYTVTAIDTVNIRSGPGTANAVIGQLPIRTTASIVGRNSDATWWQINFAGITGWVSSRYVALQSGVGVNSIPVTG